MTNSFAKGSSLLTALVSLLAFGAGLSPALADNPYGCACFHNKTGVSINYRYKWGDGHWQNITLRPAYDEALCWHYSGGNHSSPDMTFELDVDKSKGNAWTFYDIARVQSANNVCEAIGQKGHYDINFRPNTNRSLIEVTHR